MTDDFEINQLRSEIDQVRSMIPLVDDEKGGGGGEGGDVTLNGTGYVFGSSSNTDTQDGKEFTFRSANDSNVVVRMSTKQVADGENTVDKVLVTIGVYYI